MNTHPTYGRLATYARRAGIPVRDPLYAAECRERAWDIEVRSSDGMISRIQKSSITPPRARVDGHAVATWFGILCLGAMAVGAALAFG